MSQTAVLVSGNMRTADRCAPSILSAFPSADFYVHAIEDEDSHKASLFNPVRMVVEPQWMPPERPEYHRQAGRGVHGISQVLGQLWGLKRVWEMVNDGSLDRWAYKWVVRCRPDIEFIVPPEPESEWPDEPELILVPGFANYWGLNDRFAIMRSHLSAHYFRRLDRLDLYIDQGGIFHPESFLAWAMPPNVGLTRATFRTVRKNGSCDEPLYLPECGDVAPRAMTAFV